MEEENKQNMEEPAVNETPKDEEQTTETPDTNEFITNMFNQLLTEIKNLNAGLQNTSPVSEAPPEEETKEEEEEEEPPKEEDTSEPSPEEIAEVDKILQED